MEKLKFELVNGYGVLLDDSIAETGKPYYGYGQKKIYIKQKGVIQAGDTIVFADPELQLEGVPVFNWRDFEIEKLAERAYGTNNVAKNCFVYSYKSNPAKYTEEDLRKAIAFGNENCNMDKLEDISEGLIQKFIQSLQKYPKYVVMESEVLCNRCRSNDFDECWSAKECSRNHSEDFERPKLITNSEGKQEGIVKELIWES